MGTLSISKLAMQLTTTSLLLRKPWKLFAGVARVCQRQLGFLVTVVVVTTPCIHIVYTLYTRREILSAAFLSVLRRIGFLVVPSCYCATFSSFQVTIAVIACARRM